MEDSTRASLAAELERWKTKLFQLNEEKKEIVKQIKSLENILIEDLADIESGVIGNSRFNIEKKISARTLDISQVDPIFIKTSVDIRKVKSWFLENGEVPAGMKITVQKNLNIEDD